MSEFEYVKLPSLDIGQKFCLRICQNLNMSDGQHRSNIHGEYGNLSEYETTSEKYRRKMYRYMKYRRKSNV